MDRRMINFAIAGISLLLLTGCASSFQSGDLERIENYPEVVNRKSVFVDLVFSGRLNGEPWTENDKENKAFIKDRLIQTLEESGMFSIVSDGLKTTDLHLYVAVINDKEKSSSSTTLSALTLFLYPNTETDGFRVLASVKDPYSGEKETIKLSAEVKRKQQLLLGLLAPFKSHSNELETCVDRLMENLVLEIHQTGMVK